MLGLAYGIKLNPNQIVGMLQSTKLMLKKD